MKATSSDLYASKIWNFEAVISMYRIRFWLEVVEDCHET